jgi:pimeloyl-ACP methyl ester carboxylesterase
MKFKASKVGIFFLALLVMTVAIYLVYRHDMNTTVQRLASESQVIQTPYGSVEFTRWGSGPAVLALHGAGGGFDQGRAIPAAFGGGAFQWIVPSRFGYLRSQLPTDASTTAQADAFARLLDSLGIERVAIVAMSGGVPPALQFALRYPARTSALVFLSSAPYTPMTAEEQQLPVPIWIYQALFSSDFPFWVLEKVAGSGLEVIFDVRPELRDSITPEEKSFVASLVDAFQPVTMRVEGLRNEGAAIDPRTHYPLQNIKAPTLVIHARDDGINPFAFGEYTAEHIPGARFIALETGGHLLLGHHAEVRARVTAFLQETMPAADQ